MIKKLIFTAVLILLCNSAFADTAEQRVENAYYTNKFMQSQGHNVTISAKGKDKTTFYISCPYAEQNYVEGLVDELLVKSTGLKDRGFKKLIIVNNYGKTWTYTVK